MKKLLVALTVVGVGYLLWKYLEQQDERSVWTEVTDDVE